MNAPAAGPGGRGGRGGRGGGGRGRGGGRGGRGGQGGRGGGGGRGGIGDRGGRGGGGGGQVGRGRGPAGPARNAGTANDQYWADFRATTQNYWNNYFEYHRRGLTRDRTKPWEDPNIPPLYRPPSGDAWDGRYPADDVQTIFARQAAGRAGYQVFSGSMGSRRRRRMDEAQAAAQVVADALSRRGIVVRLVKVLGFGGNGIASLLEVWPGGEGGPSKKVVVKSLLREGRSMAREWTFNAALKRARHIIQLLGWGQEIMPTEGCDAEAVFNQWLPVDNDTSMLTLEFMRHGDMHGLIRKLARSNDRVPNKVLWRIFFCLVRGCIAMYEPPRIRRSPDGAELPEEQWRSIWGPDINEILPAQTPGNPDPAGWDFIHFDMDPQNVLIGENDDNEHNVAPIFKISDLGLGKLSSSVDFQTPEGAWAWRQMGKITMLLPEQYHKEWDYIDKFPLLEPNPPRVAGKYGPWSNIFQAALNLITKHTTPYPPAAIGPLNSPDGAHLFAGPAVIRDSAGRAVPPFHTHGYTLAAEPDLDRGLMHLLLRCLADLPEDRPSLWELQWLMGTMESAPDWAIGPDDPEGVRAWCDRMFGSPPAPPANAEQVSASVASNPASQQVEVPRSDRVPPRTDGGGGDDDADGNGDDNADGGGNQPRISARDRGDDHGPGDGDSGSVTPDSGGGGVPLWTGSSGVPRG